MKLQSENGGKHEAADFIDLFLDAEAEVDLTPTGYDKNNLKVFLCGILQNVLSSPSVYAFLLVAFPTRKLKKCSRDPNKGTRLGT